MRTNKALMEKGKVPLELKQEVIDLKIKAFNSQMNHHFIFNSLNAIQDFIVSGSEVKALDYLSTFSKFVRFHLNHLNRESVFLTDEVSMLHQYLRLQKLRYGTNLHYKLDKNNNVEKKVALIPSAILLPLFENIIEHGFYIDRDGFWKLKTTFDIKKDFVLLKVTFNDKWTERNQSTYLKFNKRMTALQNQIDFLNRLKKYGIKKDVSVKELNGGIVQNRIELTLPNLI